MYLTPTSPSIHFPSYVLLETYFQCNMSEGPRGEASWLDHDMCFRY